jgi:hypothetical protein
MPGWLKSDTELFCELRKALILRPEARSRRWQVTTIGGERARNKSALSLFGSDISMAFV